MLCKELFDLFYKVVDNISISCRRKHKYWNRMMSLYKPIGFRVDKKDQETCSKAHSTNTLMFKWCLRKLRIKENT